jgi:hypothetical protein
MLGKPERFARHGNEGGISDDCICVLSACFRRGKKNECGDNGKQQREDFFHGRKINIHEGKDNFICAHRFYGGVKKSAGLTAVGGSPGGKRRPPARCLKANRMKISVNISSRRNAGIAIAQ